MVKYMPYKYNLLLISLLCVCIILGYEVYSRSYSSSSSISTTQQNFIQSKISSWQDVFQFKANLSISSHNFNEYQNINGFDLTKEEWNILACTLSKPAEIHPGSSIIEFGCGTGAFLYEISTHCGMESKTHLFGIDFAPGMIQIADQLLTPSADRAAGIPHFWTSDVTNASMVPSNFFTHVVSHSVFQYLKTYENVFKTLTEMTRVVKENGTIALLDLNDADKRSLASEPGLNAKKHSLQLSNSTALNHLFISKNFLKLSAQKLGLKIYLIVDESTLPLQFYHRSGYRYSVYMKKETIIT